MRQAFEKNDGLIKYISAGEDAKPRVSVENGSFGDIPVSDASVDILIGAQCFHWADPDYQSAIAEFARVLKPNGTLALIWNLEDRNKARWVGQIRDAYEKYESGTPQYRLGWWKKMFETEAYKENFDSPQQFDYRVVHPTTSQGVVDRVWSKSYITAQSQAEQDKIAEDVRRILEQGHGRTWIDKEKSIFEYPYETNLYLMRRR